MGKGSLFVCAMMVGFALVASAANGPATKPVTGGVKGIASQVTNPADLGTSGECNFDAWVDVCPAGSCTCVQVPSPKATGGLAVGGNTISNFFVTIDNGIDPATEPPPNSIGPNPKCGLFFGALTLTSKSGESKTINLMGTSCKHVIGITTSNQSGTHDKDILSGGWGVSNSPAPTPNDASGWGTLVGTVIQSSNALSINLTGDLTQ
jgi:hypothetical protein